MTFIADVKAHGERLDKWLASRLATYSRARLQRWITDGHVTVNDAAALVRQAVREGDRVVVTPQASEAETAFVAEDIALSIVFEDDALMVVDKPADLVVHPAAGNWSGTLLNGLLHHDPALAHVPRAGIVHRLDKDTSGLMVVAKTLASQTDLVRQLQARTVGRTYLALVHGVPPASGRVATPIGRDVRDRTKMATFKVSATAPMPSGAKPAATRFDTAATVTLDDQRSVSLVVCRLETGRTHQIRVHLQSIGHPLVGDRVYGARTGATINGFTRQALHAWRLRLVHPTRLESMAWTAPLPGDMATLLETLGIDLVDALAPFQDEDA